MATKKKVRTLTLDHIRQQQIVITRSLTTLTGLVVAMSRDIQRTNDERRELHAALSSALQFNRELHQELKSWKKA